MLYLHAFVIFSTLFVLALGQSAHDSPCAQLSLLSSYDAIVVGSGPGGSVASFRLAEYNPSKKILLVERGPEYSACFYCSQSAYQSLASGDPNSGRRINTTAQTQLPGSPIITIKDPAIQGGASSINGEDHIRGDAHNYFDRYWPENWNWKKMREFYAKYETYTFPDGFYPGGFNFKENFRGNKGRVKVSQKGFNDGNGLVLSFLEAAKIVFPNIVENNHWLVNGSINNGNKPGIGACPPETTSIGAVRSSAFVSYTQDAPSNLKVITRVRVNRILFKGNKVTGVELVSYNITTGKGQSSTCTVKTNVVVSSAGALGTPKLLKLSGVGPSDELKDLGIHVVSDVPEIGTNLADHYGPLVFTVGSPTNPIPFSNVSSNQYGWMFYNVDDNPSDYVTPDNAINITPILLPGEGVVCAISILRTNGIWRGSITLRSSDPDDDPVVNPNYLGTKKDMQVAAKALAKTLKIIELLGQTIILNPCNATNCKNDYDTLVAYILAGNVTPGYHPSGTAAIDRVTDALTLAVKGTRGLYALDDSIFPRSPASNSQSTTYAVSERGILHIIRDVWKKGLF